MKFFRKKKFYKKKTYRKKKFYKKKRTYRRKRFNRRSANNDFIKLRVTLPTVGIALQTAVGGPPPTTWKSESHDEGLSFSLATIQNLISNEEIQHYQYIKIAKAFTTYRLYPDSGTVAMFPKWPFVGKYTPLDGDAPVLTTGTWSGDTIYQLPYGKKLPLKYGKFRWVPRALESVQLKRIGATVDNTLEARVPWIQTINFNQDLKLAGPRLLLPGMAFQKDLALGDQSQTPKYEIATTIIIYLKGRLNPRTSIAPPALLNANAQTLKMGNSWMDMAINAINSQDIRKHAEDAIFNAAEPHVTRIIKKQLKEELKK